MTLLFLLLVSFVISYRDSNEVKEQRSKRDPISRLVDYALDGDLATAAEFKVSCIYLIISEHACIK